MIAFLEANWLLLALLAVGVVLFLLLRNRTTKVSGLEDVLGKGKPVIVEVFSNT